MSYRKIMTSFVLQHLLLCIICFVILLALSFLADWFGMAFLSAITSLIYAISVYSQGWNIAAYERKGYVPVEPHPKRAAMGSIPVVALGLLVCLTAYIPAVGEYASMITRMYFSMYVGFLPTTVPIGPLLGVLFGLIFSVFATLGYRVGMTGFSIVEAFRVKIGWKSKPRKKRVYHYKK